MRPNLFIVGAPKCGTTAWMRYLRSHPEIFFSPVKEPEYFATDYDQARPVKSLREYMRLFEGVTSASVLGEASSRYLISKSAAKNIGEFNPAARILIFLRDQEDYIPSLHNQLILSGQETMLDLEKAWSLSGERGPPTIIGSTWEPWLFDYKLAGRFHEQVDRYFAEFPEQQIRVFHFRDWSRNPRETYLEILRFLGLADDGRLEFPKINEASIHRSPRLAKIMANQSPPVRATARLIKLLIGQRGAWRLAKEVTRANARRGYATTVSDRMREEIRRYYASANARLEARIWKPAPAAEDQFAV